MLNLLTEIKVMGRKKRDNVLIQGRVSEDCRQWWEDLAFDAGCIYGDSPAPAQLWEMIAADPIIANAVRAMILEKSKK